MILRRFTQHIKEQNWFAVGLDMMVVIVGVFIGIYIGGIASERVINQEVLRKLDVVKRQLKADLENLDRIADYREQKLQQPKQGLLALSSTPVDKQTLDESLFGSFRRVYTFFPKVSGYSNIKDSGYLEKISDPELQLVLADLYDSVYVRHIVVADESDQIIFVYHQQIVTNYWDELSKDFIGDPDIAIPRLRNALRRTKSNSEWYVQFLTEDIKPKIIVAISAIDNYQRINRH
ncbi:MAG: DUF6090 family protein [Gammaproteobacteria bacterium]|nr:DUF6090 family protein [Gammaproteobacteria bacterium]MDH5629609.1 DUF6090 family protein [Gammaproteobacteria bacterium]